MQSAWGAFDGRVGIHPMEISTMACHVFLVPPELNLHFSLFRFRVTTNPERNTAMNPECIHPESHPAALSGTSEDAAAFHYDADSRKVTGRSRCFARPIFVISGVVTCMILGSCVFPYDDYNSYGSGYSTTYRPGYRVSSLPYGYRSESISGSTYYYYDGYYYRPRSGGYVVVDAPRNSRYYDDYSRRQRMSPSRRDYRELPDRHDRRYDRGEILSRLPEGHRVVNYRGVSYYQVGSRYYRRQGDVCVITSRPF